LLPFKLQYSQLNPHITLNSNETCIEWKSLDESFIRVTPNYDDFGYSKSAEIEVIIESNFEDQNRISSGIIATISNGQHFKCNVFIDKIERISIVTTTKQLNFQIPYEVKVIGLDSKNNSFSSLEGINVNWQIDSTHLNKVNESNFLVVNPNNIGQTWIKASLGTKIHDTIYLTIENPISLFDSENSLVYSKNLLPNINYQFKLCSILGITKNKIPYCVHEIKNSSFNDYIIRSSDENIFTITNKCLVTTHEIGRAYLNIYNKQYNGKFTTVEINVKYPIRVELSEITIHHDEYPVFNPIAYFDDDEIIKIDINWTMEGKWDTIGNHNIKLSYYDYSFTTVIHVEE
jgi:hypothetical protein